MTIVTAIVCIGFGLIVILGQLISVTNFSLAQKLGLQEKNDQTESLFRHLELNTARWDLVVMWTLPAAGVLIVMDHPWWPALTLIAGTISIDTAGREAAKVIGLRKHGVKTGTLAERRLFFSFLGVMFLIGLLCFTLGFHSLTSGI